MAEIYKHIDQMTLEELKIMEGNFTAKINNFDMEKETQAAIKDIWGSTISQIMESGRKEAKRRKEMLIANRQKLRDRIQQKKAAK